MIDISPLPGVMKLEAVREVALAKIQHLLANVHIPKKALREMNNKTVNVVRKWLCLNTHATDDNTFLRQRGGVRCPEY
jgi:penicillin V acylase-like amidase (Ntn superfamily)